MSSASGASQPVLPDRWPRPTNRRVVCLPVGAETLELLAGTLSTLARNTSPEARIVVLPLAIERARLEQALRESPAAARVSLAEAVGHTDPWRAVLRGLPPAYRDDDLLLAQPGLEVPPGWDARLALAAYAQESRIAAVSPLCDSAPLFALLERRDDRIPLDALDRWLLALSPRRNIEMPALLGGCCSCGGGRPPPSGPGRTPPRGRGAGAKRQSGGRHR